MCYRRTAFKRGGTMSQDHTPPIQDTTPHDVAAPAGFGPTVTIFFSDIRGFTEFTDAYGDEAAYRMLQHHNGLVQEQIALFGGHIVKTLGDSYMVSFDAARNAVACAIGVQRALSQYNSGQQGAKIEIGIGINTGEPIREGDDLFGGSVNLASRICAVAGAGRILVSEAVRHVVGIMQGADYIDRGYFEVKGFQEPHHLFEVDWSGAGAVRATQVAPPSARPLAGTAAAAAPPASSPPSAGSRTRLPGLVGGAVALLLLAGVGGGLVLLSGRNAPAAPAPTEAVNPAAPQAKVKPAVPEAGAPPAAKPGVAQQAPAAGAQPADAAGAPPSGASAAEPQASAPGKLLRSDDFSDPARGLFRTDQ